MKRNCNGNGSKPYAVRDKEGHTVGYAAKITVNGIRKTITAKTSNEVKKKVRAAVAAVDTGTYIHPERMKLKTWTKIWLDEYCNAIKPETKRKYAADTKNHILPAIGELYLHDVTPVVVQKLVNDLQSDLSPKSVHNAHGTLHKCLAEAERVNYIPLNPCRRTILPKAQRVEIKPLQGAEIPAFLKAAEETEERNLFFTALWTGMRISELLGLTWENVNFAAGTIRIKQQISWNRGQGRQLVSLKTDRERTITPPQDVMDTLKRERTRQKEKRLRAGSIWANDLDLVFTDETGNPLIQGTIEKRCKRIFVNIGVPNRVFHDLRHTFATESLRLGTPVKVVSSMLGHASVAFTMDVYAGYTPTMQQESADRLQSELNRLKREA